MSSKKKLPWLGLALAKQLDMTSLPEAKKREAVKQRLYPSILPAHSERGFPFFCLNRADSFFTAPGGCSLLSVNPYRKIAKNKLRFSSLFVRQEFNFWAHFFFKNHKIQKNQFRSTPAYRGTPLSW